MWEADVLGSCDSFVAQTNECQPEKKSQSMSGQAPTRWTPTTVKAGLIRGLCVFIAALVGACVRTPTVHFVPMIGRADSVFNFNLYTDPGPPLQLGLSGDLARLRYVGEKQFWAWLRSCFDASGRPKPTDPEMRAEAEQMRKRIYDELEHERGTADAVFFNAPRVNESFPPNSELLSLCPEGIEITQFGYRLDRLGEIIDRIQRGGQKGVGTFVPDIAKRIGDLDSLPPTY